MNLGEAVNVVNFMDLESLPTDEAEAIHVLLDVGYAVSGFGKVLPYLDELDFVYEHVES